MPELTSPSDTTAGAPVVAPVASRARLAAAVVMALPLLLMATAALIVPAGLSYSLIVRGVRESHPSWVLLGSLAAVVWFLMLRATARKVWRKA
jgi:ABC-type proline/glycine betaine transport system permease subunit